MPSAANTPLMYSAARASFPGGLLVLIFTSSVRNFSASSWAWLKSGVGCCATSTAEKITTTEAICMNRNIASQLRTSSRFMQERFSDRVVGYILAQSVDQGMSSQPVELMPVKMVAESTLLN